MSSLVHVPAATDGRRLRRLRSHTAARITTAAISLVATLAAAVYLAAPTETAWAIAVERVANHRVPAHQVVIYGKAVNVQNQPLVGVNVAVARKVGSKLVVVTAATTGPNGTFRLSGRLAVGRYVLIVTRTHAGKTVKTTSSVKLSPGSAYQVGIKLTRTNVVAVLPVRTY